MVLGEDLAALVGLVLAFVFVALAAATGNPVFDAIGSIVIGVVLICVSIFIAVRIKGLIVGRSAEDDLQEALRAEIAARPGHRLACSTPSRCRWGRRSCWRSRCACGPGSRSRPLSTSLNALEKRIKTKFPEVAWCFVEPDVAD